MSYTSEEHTQLAAALQQASDQGYMSAEVEGYSNAGLAEETATWLLNHPVIKEIRRREWNAGYLAADNGQSEDTNPHGSPYDE